MASLVARAQERRDDQQVRLAVDTSGHGARLLPSQVGQRHVVVACYRQTGIGCTLPVPDEPRG
jgi:hypothetical protein